MNKILFSHFGIKNKGGFGRTFMLAQGLAIANDVYLFTLQEKGFTLPYQFEVRNNVKILAFPEFIPTKFKKMGYGLFSIFLKFIYILKLKFNVVISDSGHRPSSGFPCYFSKFIYKSYYISEWWDFYGEGGQYDEKSSLFKLFLGRYEKWEEIHNKKKADFIIVLSEKMRERAIQIGIRPEKILKIHGGSNTLYLKSKSVQNIRKNYNILETEFVFGYIGMGESEINDLKIFLSALVEFSLTHPQIKLITFGQKISKETKEKYCLNNLIIEHGYVNFYLDSDILTIPDIYVLIKNINITNEYGWPNKFGDYLALGKPVMLNLYGELQEFYNLYPHGLFITKNNHIDIYNTLKYIVSQSKKNLYKMGEYNRWVAENYYSWNIQALKIQEIININLKL